MVFNIANSLTDLSLFGLKRGGARVGVDNYLELVTSPDFRRVLWNTIIWLTAVGVTVRLAADHTPPTGAKLGGLFQRRFRPPPSAMRRQ